MFKEGQKTELKESLRQEEEILRTVCAMANSEGGTLYAGVKDSGKIIGVSIGKNTIENLARRITESISPPIYVDIEEVIAEDKILLKLEIPKSEYKPHFYKGIAYKRVGKINKAISPDELVLLVKKQIYAHAFFDSEISNRASIDDIDERSLKKFCSLAKKPYKGKEATMKSLKLFVNGKLPNAAIILFGKEPSLVFPMYGVKCGVFRGIEILEIEDFSENIIEAVDKVVDYISEKIPKKLVFERAARTEKPLIPKEALREAIINAVIHRDYTSPSSVHVEITDKYVKIKNPGTLPSELTEEDLYREHSSYPRNPLLAQLAHMAQYIEHWGTGTLRIIKAMRGSGLKDPVFKVERGFFITFLSLEKPALSLRQTKIIDMLKRKDRLTIKQFRKYFRVSDRMIRKELKELLKCGYIHRKGSGRNTYYTLVD